MSHLDPADSVTAKSAVTWAPLIHLQPELSEFGTVGSLADWAVREPDGLKLIRYAKEVLDMALRLRAEDRRATYLSDADIQAMALFRSASPAELFAATTQLNDAISGFGLDDWMFDDQLTDDDSDATWTPLGEVRWAMKSQRTTHDIVSFLLASLATSETWRMYHEVVSMVIRLRCRDTLARVLSRSDRQELAPFLRESPGALLESLTLINRIEGKSYTPWTDVSDIVLPLIFPEGRADS